MTFARYVLVQLVAYGIDMGVFLATLSLGVVGPLLSNVPAKISAGVFAFFVHRHFTFRLPREQRDRRQAVQYFLLLALNVPLSSAVLGAVLMMLPMPVPAKFIADVICVLFTFWISKTWVFKGRAAPSQPHGSRS